MIAIHPHLPLIGARNYIHSTSILNFLDTFHSAPEGETIDLRIMSHVLPGAKACICNHRGELAALERPAAAVASIGTRVVAFVNSPAPEQTKRIPDGFEELLPSLKQADGQTTLGHETDTPHTFWDRAVFGTKCHLALFHSGPTGNGKNPDGGQFFLSRIACSRVPNWLKLGFATEMVLDGKWARIGIHANEHRIGYILGGR